MTPGRLADAVLSALIAPPCATCGAVLERPLQGAVCEQCWTAIAPLASTFSLDTIACAHALGAYEGTLREIVHVLKYDGRRSVAPRLSSLMAEHASRVLSDADAVVPVPLHWRRHRERGFNQADRLARGLRRPVWHLLRRVRMTLAQVDLPADERRRNVARAFSLRSRWFGGSAAALLRGRTVVLVDDVATTGATLVACARVLYAAGAADVRAVTAARVVSRPR
jgi:ComF family protein